MKPNSALFTEIIFPLDIKKLSKLCDLDVKNSFYLINEPRPSQINIFLIRNYLVLQMRTYLL